jgi:hypothetical protein
MANHLQRLPARFYEQLERAMISVPGDEAEVRRVGADCKPPTRRGERTTSHRESRRLCR